MSGDSFGKRSSKTTRPGFSSVVGMAPGRNSLLRRRLYLSRGGSKGKRKGGTRDRRKGLLESKGKKWQVGRGRSNRERYLSPFPERKNSFRALGLFSFFWGRKDKRSAMKGNRPGGVKSAVYFPRGNLLFRRGPLFSILRRKEQEKNSPRPDVEGRRLRPGVTAKSLRKCPEERTPNPRGRKRGRTTTDGKKRVLVSKTGGERKSRRILRREDQTGRKTVRRDLCPLLKRLTEEEEIAPWNGN